MDLFKKIIRYYLMGISFSAIIILVVILFDYFANGQLLCPQFSNFIKVCITGGVGFGLAIFAVFSNYDYKKTKKNQF